MSDRWNRPGDGSPDASEIEDQEHHRKKLEAEVRREQEHRASGVPPKHPERPPGSELDWRPPPEMATQERGRTWGLRVAGFLLVLAVAWIAVRWISELLFAPSLALGDAVVPTGSVSPDDSVTVGVYARNESGRDGAAYALLVLQGGGEIEGPVVTVPGRDSVLVPVRHRFPAGDHVTSIVLYDAWQDNVVVGSAHGLLIRSGRPRVDVSEATLAPAGAPGDPLALDVALVNGTEREEIVVPLVVFTPETGTAAPVEVELPETRVPAGQTLRTRLSAPTTALPAGRYLITVVAVTPSGDRMGEGVHGIPFEKPQG